MRDEEGYLEAGDLGGGAYGALEGNLGHVLRPLAGFGRELSSPEPEEEEVWEGVVFTPEFSTRPGTVVYEFPTWSPLG